MNIRKRFWSNLSPSRASFFLWIATLLWILSMWHHSATPGFVSSVQSDAVVYRFWNIFVGFGIHNVQLMVFIVRKSAHLLEYAVFGTLLALLFARLRTLLALQPFCMGNARVLRIKTSQLLLLFVLTAAVVPACDETIQLFVPGRSGELVDCAIDLCGVCLGVCIVWGSYIRRINKTQRSTF